MGTVSKTYTFSAGGTVVAAEHNENFNTLYTLVNGNLDTDNLDSAAGIVDTQLAQITTAQKVNTTALITASQAENDILYATGATTWGRLANGNVGEINVVLDGGGAAIAADSQIDVRVPFACTITGVYMLADQSGSIVVDVWKDTLANFPPTDADTITASAVPTITTDTDSSDTTLTGWTTGVDAGDILRLNVDSCTSITKLTLALQYKRTN